MSQSLMINNIFPKTDKEVGMVMSYHYHLNSQSAKLIALASPDPKI